MCCTELQSIATRMRFASGLVYERARDADLCVGEGEVNVEINMCVYVLEKEKSI